jgi:hypothetical protein
MLPPQRVFQSLPFSSRLLLLGKFLARLPADEVHAKVSKKDLQELAKWELSGREIKNSIRRCGHGVILRVFI